MSNRPESHVVRRTNAVASTQGTAARRFSRRPLLLKVAAVGAITAVVRMLPPAATLPVFRSVAHAQDRTAGELYALSGPQIEPEASFWTVEPTAMPAVVRMAEMATATDNPTNGPYFPPYPSDAETEGEIAELLELATLRDDPRAVAGGPRGRERRPISQFLQIRPQPISAVYNRTRHESTPVIQTGWELARYFEAETPGLGHRLALDHLLQETNWSPPRQTRVWMALDVAIYSAMLAAWHYKWFTTRERVGYRPRPVEVDSRVSVLYDRAINRSGTVDLALRVFPTPAPGTPRHPAYPSGHSTVAGAASEVLSYFFPTTRPEMDNLADNCGMARLWAGIHYRSDHVQGLALGRYVGRMIVDQMERGCVTRAHPICAVAPGQELSVPQGRGPQQGAGNATAFCDGPPSAAELQRLAEAFSRCAARQ